MFMDIAGGAFTRVGVDDAYARALYTFANIGAGEESCRLYRPSNRPGIPISINNKVAVPRQAFYATIKKSINQAYINHIIITELLTLNIYRNDLKTKTI